MVIDTARERLHKVAEWEPSTRDITLGNRDILLTPFIEISEAKLNIRETQESLLLVSG